MNQYLSGYAAIAIILLLCSVSGCNKANVPPPEQEVQVQKPQQQLAFPPQEAMKTGKYESLYSDASRKLKGCSKDHPCDEALFNLGFLYAYSKTPYFNPSKAVKWFEELTARYPHSPYSYSAKPWLDILKRSIDNEKSLKKVQEEIKSRDDKISERDEKLADMNKRMQRSKEIDDAKIEDLNNRMQRAKEIDLEIERREKEVLP